MLHRISAYFKENKIEWLILCVSALSLSMLIDSGYYWDDAVNSTVYLYEKYDHLSLFQNVFIFMKKYIELGRINVFSFYYYFLFYIENVSIYKAIIIFSVCVNQFVFAKTVFEISGSRGKAQMAMLLIPALIQIRAYQDPVNGFYCLMQVILLELLLTVLFLLRYLRAGSYKNLFLSLIPFFIGLMTYEVCFPFIVMIPLIIFAETRNLKKTLRTTVPYALIVLSLLALIFFVRQQKSGVETYSGVAFSLDFAQILKTYLYQVFAALPLSFYGAKHELAIAGRVYQATEAMNYALRGIAQAVRGVDLLICALISYILWHIFRHRPKFPAAGFSQSPGKVTLVIGCCFWFLPATTIAVSQRYQGQIFPGLGYLPVYLEYFGVSILISHAFSWLFQNKRAWLNFIGKTAFSCLFLALFLLNLQNNRAVTELMNRSFYYPRQAGESALKGGILKYLPENARLLSLNPESYIWEANWSNQGLYEEYYQIHGRRKTDVFGIYQFRDELIRSGSIDGNQTAPILLYPENLYVISYDGDQRRGLAKLGHVKSLLLDPHAPSAKAVITDQNVYFFSGEFPLHNNLRYLSPDGTETIIPAGNAGMARNSSRGILYYLNAEQEILFDATSFAGF